MVESPKGKKVNLLKNNKPSVHNNILWKPELRKMILAIKTLVEVNGKTFDFRLCNFVHTCHNRSQYDTNILIGDGSLLTLRLSCRYFFSLKRLWCLSQGEVKEEKERKEGKRNIKKLLKKIGYHIRLGKAEKL